MFGEVKVLAEILADGTLMCYSPSHKPGRVPFYVTCSNSELSRSRYEYDCINNSIMSFVRIPNAPDQEDELGNLP
jgi:hypothetical protein